jgi:3-phenylpropionate/trans-cinnamate dioxygenase ferredoxin reductase subunit
VNGTAISSRSHPRRIVVVGGGLAGHSAVLALRQHGHDGEIALLSEEEDLPYDRPPLSKELLDGAVESTTLPADYDALGIEVRTGCRVRELSPDAVVSTAGSHSFDGLILATGSAPVRLPGQVELPRVLELRTIGDARALKSALEGAAAVVVVGAGWIGAEVATAAAARGIRVTVVDTAPAPLARALPVDITRHMSTWYAAAGIELRLHSAVAGLDDRGVRLVGGERIDADLVVVGVGARPRTDWLAGSGLTRSPDGALVVDSRLCAGPANVFAAGDIVRWPSALFGAALRVEHWEHAATSGRAAARNLLGAGEAYDPVPYFWSDQLGHRVQYAGHHTADDELVLRGRPDSGEPWSVLWSRHGRLRAVMAVDRPRDVLDARRLIGRRASVEPSLAADPAVRLSEATLPESLVQVGQGEDPTSTSS